MAKKAHTKAAQSIPNEALQTLSMIFVLGIFTVQPLAISPYKYLNITVTKLVIFAILASGLIVGTLIIYARDRTPASPKEKAPPWFKRLYPYEYAILAYAAILVISTLVNPNKMTSLLGSSMRNEGLLMQFLYLAVVWIVGRCYRLEEKHLSLFCTIGMIVGIYAIFQYYGADFLMLYPEWYELPSSGPGMQMMSTMSNRNVMSPYMCIVFIISTILFSAQEGRAYWRYLPISWISFFVLLAGSTESGYVGIAAAFAVVLPFFIKSIKQLSRFFMVLAGLMLALWVHIETYRPEWGVNPFAALGVPSLVLTGVFAVLAAALFFTKRPLRWEVRKICAAWYLFIIIAAAGIFVTLPRLAAASNNTTLMQISEVLRGNFDDEFGSGRIFIWRRTIPVVAEKPILGHGPDQFRFAFNQHYREESVAKYGVYFDKAHNEYLQVLVDAGALGLTAFVVILFSIIWRSRRGWGEIINVVAAAAVICYAVQAFFNISSPIANSITWTFVGILASVGNRNLPPAKETE